MRRTCAAIRAQSVLARRISWLIGETVWATVNWGAKEHNIVVEAISRGAPCKVGDPHEVGCFVLKSQLYPGVCGRSSQTGVQDELRIQPVCMRGVHHD